MMDLEQHTHLLTVIGIDLAIEKRWPCLGGSLALRDYDLQNLIPQSYWYICRPITILLPENLSELSIWYASLNYHGDAVLKNAP
ncbi:hypothetical protein [Candidatus Williamhamiltonella defendens]|uniref:hypothetical protein n=1 Tax=Candidatus Williamhamiltonella defendens TaxID=138072 RepID=UPI001C9E08E3|nr:hypothetical protein [Candidatus Hamiltonella defensa]